MEWYLALSAAVIRALESLPETASAAQTILAVHTASSADLDGDETTMLSAYCRLDAPGRIYPRLDSPGAAGSRRHPGHAHMTRAQWRQFARILILAGAWISAVAAVSLGIIPT